MGEGAEPSHRFNNSFVHKRNRGDITYDSNADWSLRFHNKNLDSIIQVFNTI